MRVSNKVFYVHLRKLSRNWVQLSSTACASTKLILCEILLSTWAVLNIVPQFSDNFPEKKTALLHLILMGLYSIK